MGYGPEDKSAVLELTYNYGVKEYEKGNAYAQVACHTSFVIDNRLSYAIFCDSYKNLSLPSSLPIEILCFKI